LKFMNWIIVAIIAQFLFALVFTLDKFFVSKTPLKPVVYAFYAGTLQILVLVFIPFGFKMIPPFQILIGLLSGALFVLASLLFYKSIQLKEISRIAPVVGGLIPIFTLFLSFLFIQERLTSIQLAAFLLLVLGGIIMLLPAKERLKFSFLTAPALGVILLSSLFFSGSFVLSKYIFLKQPFINGLIWTRLGAFLMAGLFLLFPPNRKLIFKKTKVLEKKTVGLFFLNKGFSATAFILLNYAIFLGSVSLVNALQGVQYVFLLLIGVFLSVKFPQIIKEQINKEAIFQKIAAIVFIGAGLAILAW